MAAPTPATIASYIHGRGSSDGVSASRNRTSAPTRPGKLRVSHDGADLPARSGSPDSSDRGVVTGTVWRYLLEVPDRHFGVSCPEPQRC